MSYNAGYAGYVSVSGVSKFTVEVDWDKTGVFSDITALVRPLTGAVTCQYGRDQSTALAPTVSGTGQITVDNRDRRFSPRNAASPLFGKVKPARPVKITRLINGANYTMFIGHTDDSPINPNVDNRSVALSLVDSLADFRGQAVSTGLHDGIRTGEAIGLILDKAGWTGGRDLDPGATVIPWWWEDGTDALTALEKVIRSEGPPAMVSVGSSGEIIFRDRHHRLTDVGSLTSQGTWYASEGVEPVMSTPFSYDEAWRNIVNTGTVSVDVRQPRVAQEVWTSDATITLSPGEQRLVTVATTDPFIKARTPVDGVDFNTTVGTVNVRLIRTSGASTAIEFTAVGGPAIIAGLRLVAQPVPVSYTVQVSATDAGSVADFGSRAFPGDLPWCSPGQAEAILARAVAQRAQPLPVVSARFVCGRNVPRSSLVLARDLSNLVTVVEAETALNAPFFIESIQHDLTGADDHSVTFGLEAAVNQPVPLFQFDKPGAGFDQGKFGNGQEDASTMFRFDTPGQGFDAGLFAS